MESNKKRNEINQPISRDAASHGVGLGPVGSIQRRIDNSPTQHAQIAQLKSIFGERVVAPHGELGGADRAEAIALPIQRYRDQECPVGGNVVQRQVRNFSTNVSAVDTPSQQLRDGVMGSADIDWVNPATLDAAMLARGLQTMGSRNRVDSVKATMRDGRPNGQAGGASDSAEVGHIGTEEVFISNGIWNRGVEGGHLVTRALWDSNDPQAGIQNRYGNLVPMSRGINIEGWADIEEQFAGARWRRWQIVPENHAYDLRESHLANILGLGLKPGRIGDGSVGFESWVPLSLNAQQTAAGGLNLEVGEQGGMVPAELADDGPSLQLLLEHYGAWHYLTAALRADVQAL